MEKVMRTEKERKVINEYFRNFLRSSPKEKYEERKVVFIKRGGIVRDSKWNYVLDSNGRLIRITYEDVLNFCDKDRYHFFVADKMKNKLNMEEDFEFFGILM